MIIKVIFQQAARGLRRGRRTDWVFLFGNCIAGMLLRRLRRLRALRCFMLLLNGFLRNP